MEENTAENLDNTTYETEQQPAPQLEQQWWNSLPDEMQGEVSKFKNVQDMVKGYISAKSLLGKKVSDFSQLDYQTYSKMMEEATNIPSSAEGYNISLKEADETGHNTFTEEDVNALKAIAAEAGLNQDQAQLLYEQLNDVGVNLMAYNEAHRTEQYQNSLNKLNEIWGAQADTKLQAVENCINDVLPKLTGFSADEIREELANAGVYMSPVIMNALASVGELSTERGSRGYGNLSPMDARNILDQKRSDPDFRAALANTCHPNHQAAIKEYTDLFNLYEEGTN